VSILERTILLDNDREISRSERKLYTLAELKEDDGKTTKSDAFQRAIEKAAYHTMEWGDWYESVLDCMVDIIREKYGIGYSPKEVSFDIDRGRYFSFGKTCDVDDKTVLRRAGIDLRTKVAKEIIDRGLVLGEHHGYGSGHNWIGFYEWECIPDYIEEMSPGITDKLHEVMSDAHDEMIDTLRKEQEYLTSKEYLLELGEINEWLFDNTGAFA
jgi:hypothetical protein